MRALSLASLASAAVLALAACGGGSDDDGSKAAAQSSEVGQLKFCVEGAGAVTAEPGQPIPELGGTPSGPGVPGASRALVIYWPQSKDVAHVYFAKSESAAADAARDVGSKAKQKGNLVVVPDADHPPSPDDEGLLIDDCLL